MNICLAKTTLTFFFAVALVSGQKGGGQSGGQGGQQSAAGGSGGQGASGGGAGLQGLSFSPAQWPLLGLPDVKALGTVLTFPGRAVFCFRLTQSNSSTQPFVLERLNPDQVEGTGFSRPCGDRDVSETDTVGKEACRSDASAKVPTFHWNACTDGRLPMVMGQVPVIGIDISDLSQIGANLDQLKLLNINVSNQQGGAINPSPVRPSFPGTTSASSGGGGAGGSPGAMEDNSGAEGVSWLPLGNHSPQGSNPMPWQPCHYYEDKSVVSDSSGRNYYQLQVGLLSDKRRDERNRGVFQYLCNSDAQNDAKGLKKPMLSGPKPTDPFPSTQRVQRVLDGTVIWQEMNDPLQRVAEGKAHEPAPMNDKQLKAAATSCVAANRTCLLWAKERKYKEGDVACVLRRGEADAGNNGDNVRHSVRAITLAFDGRSTVTPCYQTEQKIRQDNCPSQNKCVSKVEQQHLHYYRAVKAGTSGVPPLDPLSISLIPRAIFLTWPYELPGDVIPTFNVNLIYTPPVPGGQWLGNTFYPAGSVVTSSANKGHYYTALTGGISSEEPKEPDFPIDAPPTVNDGSLVWLDSGNAVPNVSAAGGQSQGGGGGGGGGGQSSGNPTAGKSQLWLARSHYSLGDVVLDPYNGHYYTMVRSNGGSSGSAPTGQPDPFPKAAGLPATVRDGDLVWMDSGTPSTDLSTNWKNTHYSSGSRVTFPPSVEVYQLFSSTASSGNSSTGTSDPFPDIPGPGPVNDGDVIWQDSGRTGPGAPWVKGTPYSVGSSVVANKLKNNHLYIMVGTSGGNTGAAQPVLPNPPGQPSLISDGDIEWMDILNNGASDSKGPWAANHNYQVGDIVHAANNDYYEVVRFTAGLSDAAPQSPFPVPGPDGKPVDVRIADGTVVWKAADTAGTQEWKAEMPYGQGAIVYGKDNPAQSWIAVKPGLSGQPPTQPAFPILEPKAVVDDATLVCDKPGAGDSPQGLLVESASECKEGLLWANAGIFRPLGADVLPWKPQAYKTGDVVFVAGIGGGTYFRAQNTHSSGSESPFLSSAFRLPTMLPVTWEDSGTSAPPSVAGGQPADQTVALANLIVPQVHTLSYFNITTGFVYNFQKFPTFGYKGGSNTVVNPVLVNASSGSSTSFDSSTGCSYLTTGNTPVAAGATANGFCPAQNGKARAGVDAVLAFTIYLPPVDAERPFRLFWKYPRSEWKTTIRDYLPAPTFAASLINPTTTFYLGASNEFGVRNLQFFYGYSLHNIGTGLANLGSQPVFTGTGTAPTILTTQSFKTSRFLGITLNLTGFLQSLYPGSSGGGGGK